MNTPRPTAVCLSPIPWEGLWTSRHEISAGLARRGWRVLFVDPPTNAARRLVRRDGRHGAPVSPSGPEILVPPSYLPYGITLRVPRLGTRVVEANARRYAGHVASEVRRRIGNARIDLLINSFMPVIGHRAACLLAPAVSVYHRSDELRQFPGWHPLYSRLEEEVARQADVVLCVSEPVRDGIGDVRPDAEILPNGVDPRPHRQALPDPRLAGLARPVAVMAGVFDRRVDPVLLQAVASVATLVMVGRLEGVAVPAGARYLGYVEHAELPAILAGADVGVVCYHRSWAGDVLKIYEYLAAGLPVVTSDLPGLSELRREVTVANEPSTFAAAVVAAASARDAAGNAHRREVAEAHSWDRRVDRLLELVGGATGHLDDDRRRAGHA